MSCPYARQMFNGSTPGVSQRPTSKKNIYQNGNHYENGGDFSSMDEQFVPVPSLDDVEDASVVTNEPLNYTSYLRLDPVLNAAKMLSHIDPSDENSPPVHDEHFFIIIHQGNFTKKVFQK